MNYRLVNKIQTGKGGVYFSVRNIKMIKNGCGCLKWGWVRRMARDALSPSIRKHPLERTQFMWCLTAELYHLGWFFLALTLTLGANWLITYIAVFPAGWGGRYWCRSWSTWVLTVRFWIWHAALRGTRSWLLLIPAALLLLLFPDNKLTSSCSHSLLCFFITVSYLITKFVVPSHCSWWVSYFLFVHKPIIEVLKFTNVFGPCLLREF